MGYSTDIFTSEPSASCICAICHDVLKSASALNCGHTFCEDCIKSVLERHNPKCPNCRANITDHKPNYIVREIIDPLIVRCPDSTECNWTGRVDAVESHGSTCIYKTIECDVEGCNHTCQRKDMNDHLSDTDVKFRHMELKYDKKLKDMETKYERELTIVKDKLNETISTLHETRSRCDSRAGAGTIRRRPEEEGAQRNVRARHEYEAPPQPQMNGAPPPPQRSTQIPSQLIVGGCGIDAINGVFFVNGESDSVPKYVRRTRYEGREMEFRLFRTVDSGRQKWFISIFQLHHNISDCDFYVADARLSDSAFGPPRDGWTVLTPVPGIPFIQYPNTT